MSDTNTWEDWVLQSVARGYQNRGYKVVLRPSPASLPNFLANFEVDAVATKPGEGILLEIVNPTRISGKRKTDALAAAIGSTPGWKLEVVYAPDADGESQLPQPSSKNIKEELANIRILVEGGQRRAAFLLAWAALEAVARSLQVGENEIWKRPQAPRRMIERLAGQGYITPNESDVLLDLIQARNSIVHGDVDLEISEGEVEAILRVLAQLIAVAAPNPHPSTTP